MPTMPIKPKLDWRKFFSRKWLQSLAIMICGLAKAMQTVDPVMAMVGFGTAAAMAGIYIWGNVKDSKEGQP